MHSCRVINKELVSFSCTSAYKNLFKINEIEITCLYALTEFEKKEMAVVGNVRLESEYRNRTRIIVSAR